MSKHQNQPSISSSEVPLSSVAAFSKLVSSYDKHFTASAVVIEQGHILLVHHRRIGAWLPPGGHIEEKEMPHEAAIREVKEETGINIAIVHSMIEEELPLTDSEQAFFLPSPLSIHAVRAAEKEKLYYHIDLAYLCLVEPRTSSTKNNLPPITSNKEVHEARWVKLSELDQLLLANNVIELVQLAKLRLGLT